MTNLEISKQTGAHAQLLRLAGEWKGISRLWFDPAKLEDDLLLQDQ